MAEIDCRRCGARAGGLADPPLPGAWGAAVMAESCATCWRAWTEEQTRLINHLGLQPYRPADKRVIYQRLHAFLRLETVEPPES